MCACVSAMNRVELNECGGLKSCHRENCETVFIIPQVRCFISMRSMDNGLVFNWNLFQSDEFKQWMNALRGHEIRTQPFKCSILTDWDVRKHLSLFHIGAKTSTKCTSEPVQFEFFFSGWYRSICGDWIDCISNRTKYPKWLWSISPCVKAICGNGVW